MARLCAALVVFHQPLGPVGLGLYALQKSASLHFGAERDLELAMLLEAEILGVLRTEIRERIPQLEQASSQTQLRGAVAHSLA